MTLACSGSWWWTDEAAHWDALHARFLTKRINHSESYSDGDACTNQAESFFSRIRRAEIASIIESLATTYRLMLVKWLGARTIAVSAMASNI